MAETLDYAIQYIVDGQAYVARPGAAGLETSEGTVENPLATITMSEDAWNAIKNGEVQGADAMFTPEKMTPSRLEKVRGTKGQFTMELTSDAGNVINSTTVFNGVETPEVTLMMKADDFAKILRGELNSQMAFMTGKIKFKGDMNFLMKLGSLM